jgi:hypothetical protein
VLQVDVGFGRLAILGRASWTRAVAFHD